MNIPATENAISTSAVNGRLEKIPKEKGHILVVEDQEMIRKLVATVLEEYGYSVTLARNGSEGVALFSRAPDAFQLVLMDLMLPLMDGNEAFQRLQAIRPGVPVAVMSGLPFELARGTFASPGFAGFIQKPFTVSEFARKVKAALLCVSAF